MPDSRHDGSRSVYKKERGIRVAKRMLAVHTVCVRKMTAVESAEYLMQCPTWMSKWDVFGKRLDRARELTFCQA